MREEAVIFIHGSLARSWEKVAEYAQGDPHDRSKLEVLVAGRFYPLVVQKDDERRPG